MPETKSILDDFDMQEEIVITGISGRFPESDNIDELKENLYNHVDLITEDERRWPLGFYGLPTRSGKLKDLGKFDAQFFGVHGKQANNMDPQARLLLELTYEAIVDAGYNPQQFRGTRTGVYIGACVSEVEEALVSDVSKSTGYALTGCSRSMFANRVSFTFDFQGPSYTMDTACSSGFLALQQAVSGLRTNQCDQAIVGGVNICLRPATSLQFHKLNMLSVDGKCKHLDAECNGYVRSETCSAIFLQKRSEAKRIYATIIHAKTNTDGHKEEGITFPSTTAQETVMRETVQEAGINPLDVNYFEAHGTGTPAGDPVETRAIARVFCQNRKQPLLIGSVKSNLGHAEPASALNSIAKVLLTFQNKLIPANLHFSAPNEKISELMEGKVKPVTENTPYNDGIVAINSFGFGGVNVHCLLKPHTKELDKRAESIVDKIPRLILATGRSDESVGHIFEFIEKNPDKVNAEFLALLQDISLTYENSGMNSRGYMIADKHPDGVSSFPKEINRVPEKRPVWFVYSGMGSQWTGMAKAMMAVDIFRQSIERSAQIMKPYNIDLMDLLLSDDEKALDTTVAPFVAIAAIQIALTDILRALGIEPDGIVGHSVGELGCAYGDGVFNQEQMLLAAYWRGKCVEDAKLPHGLMAAVGLTWEEAKARCPKGVAPACHNSHDSVTISGAYEPTKKLVEQLQEENIFAREVKSCGVAFHSDYMQAIAPTLLEKLEKVLPDRKLRSSRWLSSSYPESQWGEDDARHSAPIYYVHNLTSPVLFHDAVQKVPPNAIIIEIAPHCLLQPIIKRTLGADITYLAMMKRNNNDGNLNMLLAAIGKMYNVGLNPNVAALYPRVEYPVSRSVQSLSPLIKWDHSQSWLVPLYPEFFNPNNMSDYSIKVDLQDGSDKFYAGHCIDGRILFPATGYLFLAWQILSKIKGHVPERTPVEFENVTLHRATILHKTTPVKFDIRLMEVTGQFIITEAGTVVVTGRIFVPEKDPLRLQNMLTDGSVNSVGAIKLGSKDVYKELRLRGYDYGPTFQGIQEATSDSRLGKIRFTNWIVLADSMLQIGILEKNTRGLYLPVRFQSVRCNPKVLFEAVERAGPTPVLDVVNDPRVNATVVPGLEIHGLKVNLAPRRLGGQVPTLEKYQFTAYNENEFFDSGIQDKIDEYITVTTALGNKVIDLLKLSSLPKSPVKVEESTVDKYLAAVEEEPEAYPLLAIIKKLLMEPNRKQEILSEHQGDLSGDLLSTVNESQYYLRTAIEMVVENLSSPNLKVVEVNGTSRTLAHPIKHYIEATSYSINTEYTQLLSSNVDQPEEPNVERISWSNAELPLETSIADLIVYKDSNVFKIPSSTVDYGKLLQSAHRSTKNNGFLLAIFRSCLTPAEKILCHLYQSKCETDYLPLFKTEAQRSGFRLVSDRSDGKTSSMLLFRKLEEPSPNAQTVVMVTNTDYGRWVNELKDKLLQHQKKPAGENIWLVAMDNPANGVVGLVKCLRQEPGGSRIRCILNSDPEPEPFSFEKPMYHEVLHNDLVVNVYKNGQFGSFRHYEMERDHDSVAAEHAYLNVATRGDLSSLRWFEAQHKFWSQCPPTNGTDSLFTVYYAPLNFRDIMLATGKLPPDALPGDLALQDCILGLEFAGRNERGERQMGMVPAKGLATTVVVQTRTDFLWPIPDQWTMQDAATVPVVYGTAYYALIVRGELEPGESVLIHSGSGGVGQAAISICLSMGCTVFTTVGSPEKKTFLMKTFPQLTERNFAHSRDTSFEQHILRETDGRGVDVVLNSLSDDKLQASVRCLAQHGRFLEIGKYDLSQNNPLGMGAFLKNITFHGILLDALFDDDLNSALVNVHKKMVYRLVEEGIRSGAVRPLRCNLFDADQAEEAFRFMASGKHIGKVVLRIRQEEQQRTCEPSRMLIDATPRTVFLSYKSYIITGGLGGFGLELARWLVERGAARIVLTSRHGPRVPYQHLCLQWLRDRGVKCVVSTSDISTEDGTIELIREAEMLGPVGGIFNLAMVLHDGFFENQTPDAFEAVCVPKVLGTQNLDRISRKLCPDLDYFVAFSSISCGRGNAGQANYGFANSSMERVCELRRSDGLHGLAIQWGAIGDVGVVSENMGGNDVVIGGTVPQRIPSCLAVLDRFMQSSFSVCSSHVRAKRQTDSGSSGGKKADLVKTIAHILGIKDAASLSHGTSLSELGMDSLMGVEVKQTLERDYEVILSMQELRSLTIANLIEIGGQQTSSGSAQKSGGEKPKINLQAPTIVLPTEKFAKLNQTASEVDQRPIFFLAPIEGDFKLLQELADQLKRPVIGLNWTAALKDMKTIDEASAYFVKLAKDLNVDKNQFDLVGYSFGTAIAFDMALRLQAENVQVNLVLLDASPNYLFRSIEQFRKGMNITTIDGDEDSKFLEALTSFVVQLAPLDYDYIRKELTGSGDTKESWLSKTAEILKRHLKDFQLDDLSLAAQVFASKMLMMYNYRVNKKFRGDIMLLRAEEEIIETNQPSKPDYGASEIVTGKCIHHILPGNHKSFIQKNLSKLASLINENFK